MRLPWSILDSAASPPFRRVKWRMCSCVKPPGSGRRTTVSGSKRLGGADGGRGRAEDRRLRGPVATDPKANRQAGVVVALAAAGAAAGEVTLAADDLAWQAIASLAHWGVWVPATYWNRQVVGRRRFLGRPWLVRWRSPRHLGYSRRWPSCPWSEDCSTPPPFPGCWPRGSPPSGGAVGFGLRSEGLCSPPCRGSSSTGSLWPCSSDFVLMRGSSRTTWRRKAGAATVAASACFLPGGVALGCIPSSVALPGVIGAGAGGGARVRGVSREDARRRRHPPSRSPPSVPMRLPWPRHTSSTTWADPQPVRPELAPARMPVYDLDERQRLVLALFATNEIELRGVDDAFRAAPVPPPRRQPRRGSDPLCGPGMRRLPQPPGRPGARRRRT